jgi:hypothetical protein
MPFCITDRTGDVRGEILGHNRRDKCDFPSPQITRHTTVAVVHIHNMCLRSTYICIHNLLCVLKYLSGTHNSLRVDISAVNFSDTFICRTNYCAGITMPEQSAGEQINYQKVGQSLSEIDCRI